MLQHLKPDLQPLLLWTGPFAMCFVQMMMQVHMHLPQRTRGQITYIDWSRLFLEACRACGGAEEHSHFLCVHNAEAVSFPYSVAAKPNWKHDHAAVLCSRETGVKAFLLLLAHSCTLAAYNAAQVLYCPSDVSG